MSGKFEKNKSKKRGLKGLWILLAIVLLAVAAVLLWPVDNEQAVLEQSQAGQTIIATHASAEPQDSFEGIALENDLTILDIGSYNGIYMEDGTDEVVDRILMLKLENNGDKTVEYSKITMTIGDNTAEFTVSTLNPGDTAVLLEKNRMAFDSAVDYSSAVIKLENLALFDEPLDLHEDQLSIQILDGAINVTNISGQDISGRIGIYYKNYTDGIYYGGITYRVTLEGGLKAGEIRQMMADHFSDTGSRIMFVTVAQE